MGHVKGINWQLIHELCIFKIKWLESHPFSDPEAYQWELDELNRNNDIAVKEAEKQS